jgi:hypothetical protein
VLSYDKDTGEFRWREDRTPAVHAAMRAGHTNDNRYVRIPVNGRCHSAARVAWLYMTGSWPVRKVARVDGDRSNNRWDNLVQFSGPQRPRRKVSDKLTHEELKRILHYSPRTGRRYWRVKVSSHVRAGEETALSVDGSGYRQIMYRGRHYNAARLAWFYMTGVWPETIDHKNQQRDDDRWVNLRSASWKEQSWNRRMRANALGYSAIHHPAISTVNVAEDCNCAISRMA